MKSRVFFSLVVLMIVAGLAVGCAAPAPAPTPTPTPAPTPAPVPQKPFEWPHMLVVMGSGTTAPGYIIAVAWTPLHQKDTGANWRVTSAASSAERMQSLLDDVAQFYYVDVTTASEEMTAGSGYQTTAAATARYRITLPAYNHPWGICTFADSGMKTIRDIKPGTTIGTVAAVPITVQFYNAFRGWLNMTEKDLIQVPFGSFEAKDTAFSQGQTKLTLTSPTNPNVLEWMTGPHGVQFFNWPAEDKEGEARFHEVLPAMPLGPVTAGPKEFYGIRMPQMPWVAIAKAETDAELVYRLVKWTDENYNLFKDRCAQCSGVTIQHLRDIGNFTFVPFHDGTIRYLKEKGMWTKANDARQQYNVWLSERYIEAYKTAKQMAVQKGLEVSPINKEWGALWNDYKKEIGIPRMRIMSDAEIAAELAKIKK